MGLARLAHAVRSLESEEGRRRFKAGENPVRVLAGRTSA